jgi:hypothetical protein
MPTQIVVDITDSANLDAWGLHPVSGGAWTAGDYAKGSVASYGGALWFATTQTSATPGVGPDWAQLLASPWAGVLAWAASTAYSATAPASLVIYSGTTYVCTTSHTSGGSFDPTKWTALALAAVGAMLPLGTWNANTNSPALASGTGTAGYLYVVSTAGTTALDGITSWNVGDFAYFYNGVWNKLRGKTVNSSDIADATAFGRALLIGASAAAQRAALGLAMVAASGAYGDLSGTPAPVTVPPQFVVRQTVAAGPVDANGLPTLFPATFGSLALTTQNVSSSAPFVATAAQGFTSQGPTDYGFGSTSNLSWSSLTANSTLYFYVNASTGAKGFTSHQPIYQWGGTPSTTNGQFTFNISQMTGYMGNGSIAPATPLVFVGECVTGPSTVTSAKAYAYNGIYEGPWNATLPTPSGTPTNFNHNLGLVPDEAEIYIQCLTANNGYSVGDVMPLRGNTISYPQAIVAVDRNSANWATTTGQNYSMLDKYGASTIALTTSQWAYRLKAARGW